MLDFADLPYQFFPPKRNALVAWVMAQTNRWHRLPSTLKIDKVEVSGLDELHSGLNRRGRRRDRLLFLPNHPTHADAAVFLEAVRQAGISTQMMAAYDVFLRSKLDAWVMQKMGAFSVDREGSDQRAMKQAAAVLAKGKHALTIFPEGNVYLRNDKVTPFNDGAAFIAIRAAKELAKHDVRVLAVPVSIKVTHVTDCRAEQTALLHELLGLLDLPKEDISEPRETIVRVGTAALRRNIQQRGLDAPDNLELADLIVHAAGAVMDTLEKKLGIESKPNATVIDRVRAARRVIHEVRTSEERAADHAVARTWADEAMLAFRIASYRPDYVAERSTLDRVGETIEKLTEDLKHEMLEPTANRCALVRFNPPIVLGDYIGKDRRGRQAVRDLTADCEASVQAGLDALNETNPHPGGKLWDELSGG